MLKQEDPESKKRPPDDDTVLNLAEGLVTLLAGTREYCTPGHRMGHGYHLLAAGLIEIIRPAHRPASRIEAGEAASPEFR